MEKELILNLQNSFNQLSNILENTNIEYWYARDLQKVLGYERWENFANVIQKVKISCENANIELLDHFRDVTKMVSIGSNTQREIEDIILTRYACYLIAQNGDSKKVQISFAQTYFAIQTRKQELLEQKMELEDRLQARAKLREAETELSKNIYERGVDDSGFAKIRSKGDTTLFGGNSTQNMKDKLEVPQNRALADFLPTITITAKNLATEITNHNVKQNNLFGENSISNEHIQNNKSVRGLLEERGIKPEELPASEDLKKLERKIKSDEKNDKTKCLTKKETRLRFRRKKDLKYFSSKENKMQDLSNLVVYNDGELELKVSVESETIWLTQKQMSELFGTSTDNIGLHLKNIYFEKELDESSTTENFSVVRIEGNRTVKRTLLHYNLDAIICVGYRVSSVRATKFRQWATNILKNYIQNGYVINSDKITNERFVSLENSVDILRNKVENI